MNPFSTRTANPYREIRDGDWPPDNRDHNLPCKGYLHERVKFSHRERGFFEQWKKDCKHLADIIGRDPTWEDYWTAATLMQWLGTNVGMGFLDNALRVSGCVIHGEDVSRPAVRYEDEALLRSMREVQADVIWEERRVQASAHAAQMLFDLSEPN